MEKLTKGLKAKNEIITRATEVFNQKGIHTTLNELAEELGQSISYITNHFRTKDYLFVAIAQRYEAQHKEINVRFNEEPGFNLNKVVRLFSAIMDNQYTYRCSIIAVFASSNSQKALFQQVNESFVNSRNNIRQFVEALVATGYLDPRALSPTAYEVLKFQFINLFMAWLVNLELFDYEMGYEAMKPIYLEGILNCLLPHMTPFGSEAYSKLNFTKLS
ncbi:MAG: TetR/AcrR family transcriptional regulator [Saprospiraceae bacterium]|nr:TetR/AcrR family transcriptional regulator [Saprospiraceae bacterium]